ncbi:hypothetical protein Q5752_001777 [Cryptotrichosporon argae]
MASMMSRLRKRAEPSSSPPTSLRPALSLPDLTTPLLEINVDAMPSSSTFPSALSSLAHSHDHDDDPVALPDVQPGAPLPHAGFGLAQTHGAPSTPKRSRAPSLVRRPNGQSPQFHRPFTPWQVVPALNGDPGISTARASMAGSTRRRKGKAYSHLNVVVAGQRGVGKSSFIHTLLRSLDIDMPSSTRPTARPSLSTHVLESPRLLLRLIDTPGLAPAGPTADFERERGMTGLLRMVEEKLAEVMREESKVVRRKDEGDELIHLVVYMLDARDIVKPGKNIGTVEWTLPTEEEHTDESWDNNVAAVPTSELEAIRRLAVRANIVAVLGHADGLTITELEAARQAARRDLASVGMLGEEGDEADEEADASMTGRPLTPASLFSVAPTYTFFAPDASSMSRKFPWGEASVLDPLHSDLVALRDAMLADKAEQLRETTREVLYERFRTERLLAKHARGPSA